MFFAFFFTNNLIGLEKGKAPQIIFLTGPSCSGKTTLARALQNYLKEPFLYISLDQMIEMMPPKINQWQDTPGILGFSSREYKDFAGNAIAELKIGPFAKTMRKTFTDICSTLVRKGHKIIVDDVFFEAEDVNSWMDALQEFEVFWIKLTAPIMVLEDREKKRKNHPGCARYQFYYSYEKDSYDLKLDTSQMTTNGTVSKVLEAIF